MSRPYTHYTLLIIVLLSAWRAPQLLVEPRFWAEEAPQFFRYAFQHSWFDSLTYVQQRTGGYFNLSATLPATLAAHLAPLEFAPTVTTYFSLIVQLIAFSIIIYGKSLLWKTPLQKILACLIVLFAPTATAEVWLNTINLQVYCGLISVVLLTEDTAEISQRRCFFYGALLFFCGLCGIYTTFLFPAFVLKVWIERSRGSWVLLGSAFITAAIQAFIFISLKSQGQISSKKMAGFDWAMTSLNTLFHQYSIPLFGQDLTNTIFTNTFVHPIIYDSQPTEYHDLYGLISIAIAALVLLAFAEYKLKSPRWLLIVAFAGVSAGTSIGAVGGVAGGRYGFLPGALLLLLVLANLDLEKHRMRTAVCSIILGWSLFHGALIFRDQKQLRCAEPCPVWVNEVSRWKEDPSHCPRTWPDSWKVCLRKKS